MCVFSTSSEEAHRNSVMSSLTASTWAPLAGKLLSKWWDLWSTSVGRRCRLGEGEKKAIVLVNNVSKGFLTPLRTNKGQRYGSGEGIAVENRSELWALPYWWGCGQGSNFHQTIIVSMQPSVINVTTLSDIGIGKTDLLELSKLPY